MAWSSSPAPHELLDDGFAPEPCELLVIGCGNILRGDDAVGPVLIRHLFTRGVPDGVRLVDGGTAGMDVAFGMRGAARVVIVDASATGVAPGTVYRVPAEELTELPPIDGLHTHNFRWDHALSFSSWLLGPQKPTDITVFLVEAGQLEPGSELSAPVAAGMETVMGLIEREFYPVVSTSSTTEGEGASTTDRGETTEGASSTDTVEINDAGYLHLPAALAAAHFPADVCVARMEGGDLVLMPLIGAANGGLVLKQRNVAGDRSLLVNEVLAFTPVAGTFEVSWDESRAALRVLLSGTGEADGDRGPDGGRGRARSVDGLPAGADPGGDRAAGAAELLHPGEGATGGRRDQTDGGPATGSTRGSR
ncbi:hydrogenase maturation protease [Nocardioides sp.]|uniref:hydrogenase maturation protease n=1 Tax=Nocardioides sp. TaxID=35761 RepID=UPI003D0DBC3F